MKTGTMFLYPISRFLGCTNSRSSEVLAKGAIIFTLLGALLLDTSCGSKHKEKKEHVKFTITSALKQDTVVTREYVAQIRAVQHIEVRALERGYLQKIYVDEGQAVKQGQLMFQIMPLLYKAEQEKAQAEADFAKIEYQNTKDLADSDVVSKNELSMAKAKYDKAKAMLSLAQVHLGFTQVKAPFNGIMDRFQVRLGSLVEEGDLLTTLSDNSEMWVYFNVPEAEYLDYRTLSKKDEMMKVQLLMANHQLFGYPGLVKAIEADFNNETGNIAFRATFPNPDKLLRHGETGNVLVRAPLKDALIIPQKATFEVLDKKYVYVLTKDNVLKSRKIEIKAELPDLYIVKSGIDENDKILLEGLRIVKENDKITAAFQDPKKVISNLKLHAE